MIVFSMFFSVFVCVCVCAVCRFCRRWPRWTKELVDGPSLSAKNASVETLIPSLRAGWRFPPVRLVRFVTRYMFTRRHSSSGNSTSVALCCGGTPWGCGPAGSGQSKPLYRQGYLYFSLRTLGSGEGEGIAMGNEKENHNKPKYILRRIQ